MDFLQKALVFLRHKRYPGSRAYWEHRYKTGGHSGSGSSGLLAAYKAEIVNQYVAEQGINTILELGCGDGQQLRLAEYPFYTGLDISPSAVARCQAIFATDPHKKFALYNPENFNPEDFLADMALSMEVIFHLTEDSMYRSYMQHLFASARRCVVVFSSNTPDDTGGVFPHFKSRAFLPDVPPEWTLRRRLPNPHAHISVSEFFFFEKTIAR